MCLKRLFVIAFVLMMFPHAPVFAGDTATTTFKTPAATDEKSPRADDNAGTDRTMTRMSVRDRFRVSMRSSVNPLPLNRIHSWTVHVETPDGKAIENASIGVYGGMPMHKHGLPTKPRMIENMGNGDYTIDGIKFSMSGRWELLLIITVDGKRDKAKFNIDLP